jgi:hypothetical protein
MAYRKCYQVIVSKPYHKNFSNPIGFGSGFIIQYANRMWFVTADHVVSPDNNPDFVSWGNDCLCGIPTGVNDEDKHQHITLLLKDRYEFVVAEQQRTPDDPVFPKMVDISFADADYFVGNCKSLGFYDKNFPSVAVESGSDKLYFTSNEIILDGGISEGPFFVIGSILGIKRIDMVKSDHLHVNLTYDRQADGEIVLKTKNPIDIKEWSGLSGLPVVDYNGRVLGALLRATPNDTKVYVEPMKHVIEKIRQVISLMNSGVDFNEPFIVVGPNVTLQDVKNNMAVQTIVDTINNNRS